MLILPLARRPSQEYFPWITALLVLVNVLVFWVFQTGDSAVERAAADRYIDSGVLVEEWDWFADWADLTNYQVLSTEDVDRWLDPVGESREADRVRLSIVESEPDFRAAVESGMVTDPEGDAFARWQQARDQLGADRSESFTRSYLLRYDEFSFVTLVTHQFMHAGLGHLIGNMVFLVLLGLLLEPVLGRLQFLTLYLFAGLAAGLTSLGLNWGVDGGGLGASGAIAGLMGLLAVVFGRRKVRFFYWVFVYFDYVRAPALVLLPLWLGWELVAWATDTAGRVAYEAHVGGMIAGALLGFLVVRWGHVNQAALEMDGGGGLEQDRRAIERAHRALDALDAATAKRYLNPLLARHADEPKLWRLYFATCCLRSGDPELESVVRRIFRLPDNGPEVRELISETFSRYRQLRNDRIRIPVSLAVFLAHRLARWDDIDGARFLVDRMSQSNRPIQGLPEATSALAAAVERAGHPGVADYR